MKNNSRKIAAILLSIAFVVDAFFNSYVLLFLSPASAPSIVFAELAVLAVLGWGTVYAWQSEEKFTCKEKRTYVSVYCLFLALAVITMGMQLQIASMALSTVNQALAQNTGFAWALLAAKVVIPAVALGFVCSKKETATVVFEEGTEPENLETEEAIEELTEKLDDVEEEA